MAIILKGPFITGGSMLHLLPVLSLVVPRIYKLVCMEEYGLYHSPKSVGS